MFAEGTLWTTECKPSRGSSVSRRGWNMGSECAFKQTLQDTKIYKDRRNIDQKEYGKLYNQWEMGIKNLTIHNVQLSNMTYQIAINNYEINTNVPIQQTPQISLIQYEPPYCKDTLPPETTKRQSTRDEECEGESTEMESLFSSYDKDSDENRITLCQPPEKL